MRLSGVFVEYASIYSIAYWHYSICKPEKQYSENHKLLTLSIKCPAHAAKAIFSFAQALTPDTKLVDSVLILPEEYKQAVKTFIEVIL